MLRVLLGAAILALFAAPLQAGGKGGPPGPPPRVMVAYIDAGGRAFLEIVQYTTFFQFQERVVKVGDREEKRKVKIPVMMSQQVKVALDGKGVRIMTAGGKRVSPKDVRALLTRTSPVLLSADGKDVDPLYLRLARPDTLVVIAPEAVRPGKMGEPLPPVLVPKSGEDRPEKRPLPR